MMMMYDQEEAFVCQDQSQIIKGKRSKRPRQASPLSLAMCSSSTTTITSCSDDSRGFVRGVASPTTSIELVESREEDEDMVNCLMLLARGGRTRKFPVPQPMRAIDVHRCKTCDRSFTSFQALGGHRASHKKPKVVDNEESNKGLNVIVHDMNTTLSLRVTNKSVSSALGHNNKVPKVHECSMCGVEFSSGQALGGHMRRHRTLTNVPTSTTTTTTPTKQRSALRFDLNLPAPEDDHHQRESTKFSFASKQEKLMLFSSSSLVDCHY